MRLILKLAFAGAAMLMPLLTSTAPALATCGQLQRFDTLRTYNYPPEISERCDIDFGYLWTRAGDVDAQVYVDGEYVGMASEYSDPASNMTIGEGMHKVEFKAEGYKPYDVTVYIIPGETSIVDYELAKAD